MNHRILRALEFTVDVACGLRDVPELLRRHRGDSMNAARRGW
jgi:hypothetical protein